MAAAKPAPSTTIACSTCSTRNRVPVSSSGKPRCATCHADLPWLADVSSAAFNAVVASSALPIVVDLWAPWCGPCRTIAPALEKIARERAGRLRVVKINVEKEPEMSARLGVQGIPTLVLFNGGKEIGRQVGAVPAARIATWIDSSLAAVTR